MGGAPWQVRVNQHVLLKRIRRTQLARGLQGLVTQAQIRDRQARILVRGNSIETCNVDPTARFQIVVAGVPESGPQNTGHFGFAMTCLRCACQCHERERCENSRGASVLALPSIGKTNSRLVLGKPPRPLICAKPARCDCTGRRHTCGPRAGVVCARPEADGVRWVDARICHPWRRPSRRDHMRRPFRPRVRVAA